MKHTIITLFLGLSSMLSAQITVNRNHLIGAGQKIVQAYHESRHAFASSGANQTWDFSDLDNDGTDSMHFGMPDWFKGYQNFPDANLAYMDYGDDSSVYFLKASSTELRMLGFYEFSDSSEGSVRYDFKIATFPSTFNTSFNDNVSSVFYAFEFGMDPDSSGPIPFIDSVRLKMNRSTKSLVDGWGNLKTPLGTYAALKQTNQDIGTQIFEMKTNGFWLQIPKAALDLLGFPEITPDTSYSVNFWTDDASVGFPLMSYNYSNGDDSANGVSWTYRKSMPSSVKQILAENAVLFPNPATDILSLKAGIEHAEVKIMDFNGRTVLSITIGSGQNMDISSIPAGVYLVQISDPNSGELIAIQKLIKQ